MIDIPICEVVRQEEEGDGCFLRGDGQQNGHHRVESHRHPVAFLAIHRALELTVEQVCDNRLVAKKMLVPAFGSCLLLVLSLLVAVLDVWLLAVAVKVFAQKVENCGQALVRIVLTVALELLSVFPEDPLEHVWPDYAGVSVPHFV